ncbi:MAG: TonB-dependent receptor [Mariniphaga sp.]|nr:TonB-dependent receptor [Mariniphaga sp.]
MNQKSRMRRTDHVVTFRKFGRKGYSAFQSMHKAVRIGCLSVSYLLFAIPSSAERNMMVVGPDTISSMKNIEVEPIVVSAQRAPVAFPQVARIVKVIGKEEIQSAPVQSLQDLLEYSLNVDVRQRGNYGVQADISIRGGSFDQVLILLNGININDPQTGHHSLNLPVSFDAIERIEILEGPASRIYGPNAFSGAINIITGTSDKSNLKARVSGGQNGFYDTGLSGTFVSGKLTNFVSADHRSSDGYIKNTDFKLTDAFYQGKLSTNAGNLEWQAGHTDRSFGANSFYTPAYPDQFEQVKTTFASIKMETGEIVHFTPSVYWRRNQDRFELFRYPELTPTWYKDHNYHLTDVYGTNLNAWFTSKFGKTAFGADFRSENIWSTVLGKPLTITIPVPGENGKVFTKSDTRTNFSLFAEHSIYLQRFTASAGMMAIWNSQLGQRWNFYPGIDLSWRVFDAVKWYTSINSSLRLPTFTDLYYSSATNIGNSSLKPEKAVAYESGFKYQFNGIDGHLSYFHRSGKDMIDWVKKPDENIWYAQNITELNTDGIEFSAKINPQKFFDKKLFIKSINLSWSWLTQSKQSGIFASKYVLDFLNHKIDLGISHSVVKNVGINWQISYQDRNGSYTNWEGSKYGNEVEYKPFVLVDSRLHWTKNNTNIYLEASNLFDKSYYDFGNIAQPGRSLRIGIIHQFNL